MRLRVARGFRNGPVGTVEGQGTVALPAFSPPRLRIRNRGGENAASGVETQRIHRDIALGSVVGGIVDIPYDLSRTHLFFQEPLDKFLHGYKPSVEISIRLSE